MTTEVYFATVYEEKSFLYFFKKEQQTIVLKFFESFELLKKFIEFKYPQYDWHHYVIKSETLSFQETVLGFVESQGLEKEYLELENENL